MAKNTLNITDIATILVEELDKLEGHTKRLEKVTAQTEKIINTQLTELKQLDAKGIQIDATNLNNHIGEVKALSNKRVSLPKWAAWALILQPLIIAIITVIVVWLYIDNVERVAYSDGYNTAKMEYSS